MARTQTKINKGENIRTRILGIQETKVRHITIHFGTKLVQTDKTIKQKATNNNK